MSAAAAAAAGGGDGGTDRAAGKRRKVVGPATVMLRGIRCTYVQFLQRGGEVSHTAVDFAVYASDLHPGTKIYMRDMEGTDAWARVENPAHAVRGCINPLYAYDVLVTMSPSDARKMESADRASLPEKVGCKLVSCNSAAYAPGVVESEIMVNPESLMLFIKNETTFAVGNEAQFMKKVGRLIFTNTNDGTLAGACRRQGSQFRWLRCFSDEDAVLPEAAGVMREMGGRLSRGETLLLSARNGRIGPDDSQRDRVLAFGTFVGRVTCFEAPGLPPDVAAALPGGVVRAGHSVYASASVKRWFDQCREFRLACFSSVECALVGNDSGSEHETDYVTQLLRLQQPYYEAEDGDGGDGEPPAGPPPYLLLTGDRQPQRRSDGGGGRAEFLNGPAAACADAARSRFACLRTWNAEPADQGFRAELVVVDRADLMTMRDWYEFLAKVRRMQRAAEGRGPGAVPRPRLVLFGRLNGSLSAQRLAAAESRAAGGCMTPGLQKVLVQQARECFGVGRVYAHRPSADILPFYQMALRSEGLAGDPVFQEGISTNIVNKTPRGNNLHKGVYASVSAFVEQQHAEGEGWGGRYAHVLTHRAGNLKEIRDEIEATIPPVGANRRPVDAHALHAVPVPLPRGTTQSAFPVPPGDGLSLMCVFIDLRPDEHGTEWTAQELEAALDLVPDGKKAVFIGTRERLTRLVREYMDDSPAVRCQWFTPMPPSFAL